MKKTLTLLCALLTALPVAVSCKKSADAPQVKAGKFVILGTKTDNGHADQAKANAENALQLHPDLGAMVGLYGYNPGACLEALKDADARGAQVTGKIKIFGFDGMEQTLNGLKDGSIEGTVVQQPFEFGYQSMKALKDLTEGKPVASKDGIISIPVKIIVKETAAAYQTEVHGMLAAGKSAPAAHPGAPVFAFISNNQSSFWEEARAGCYKAQADLGINVDFQMPGGQVVTEQNRIIESLLVKDQCKGMALSVISPKSQADLLKQVADKMPLVTHDSDAPESPRKVYLGTNNYDAGVELGKFIRQRMPDGGKLMLFVGDEDTLNAAERKRGLIDALSAP